MSGVAYSGGIGSPVPPDGSAYYAPFNLSFWCRIHQAPKPNDDVVTVDLAVHRRFNMPVRAKSEPGSGFDVVGFSASSEQENYDATANVWFQLAAIGFGYDGQTLQWQVLTYVLRLPAPEGSSTPLVFPRLQLYNLWHIDTEIYDEEPGDHFEGFRYPFHLGALERRRQSAPWWRRLLP